MSDQIEITAQITRWQGEKAVYHLVSITGEPAATIAMHACLQRLEFGTRRGFGSVKVTAQIGETRWKSSVFPQKKSTEWVLLVSKKIMQAEELSAGDRVKLTLELL